MSDIFFDTPSQISLFLFTMDNPLGYQSGFAKMLLKTIFIIGGIYLFSLAFLMVFQDNLIFLPSPVAFPQPKNWGLPHMKIISFKTHDGLTLKAWYQAAKNAKTPTLVYFHGNAGHLGYRARLIAPYLKNGFGVLLVSYRGYSGNPGKPSEKGLYADGQAALKFLEAESISPHCIVLYGESLGAAVSIELATQRPVGGLVLQSTFTSLGTLGQYHYPLYPVKWLVKYRFDNLAKMKNVHAPILVLHGEKDAIVPPRSGKQILAAANPPKQSHFYQDRGHNDLFTPQLAKDVIIFIENKISPNCQASQSYTISSGFTQASNSASVKKPNATDASFKVDLSS